MKKAYKYRLYPNKATSDKLQWVLDRCRELYNAALQERKEAYKYAGRSISVYEQKRDLVEIKEVIRPEYQEIGSHVLQDVMFRLDKAFKAFFRRIKAGETPGYPRFQGKNRYDSFCYSDPQQFRTHCYRTAQVSLYEIEHVFCMAWDVNVFLEAFW